MSKAGLGSKCAPATANNGCVRVRRNLAMICFARAYASGNNPCAIKVGTTKAKDVLALG